MKESIIFRRMNKEEIRNQKLGDEGRIFVI